MAETAGAGAGRRAHMTMRLEQTLKSALDQAASENGRSISQEVEKRLSQSFEAQEMAEKLVSEAFKQLYGGERAHKIALMLSTSVRVIENREQAKFGNDAIVNALVFETMRFLMEYLFPEHDKIATSLPKENYKALTREAFHYSSLVVGLLSGDADHAVRALAQLDDLLKARGPTKRNEKT